MSDSSHPIRLVAAIEFRPGRANARFVFERDAAVRIGEAVAEDLLRCVPDVATAHLVTGPALLEPAQALSPDHAPWSAMRTVAAGAAAAEPGLTALGAVRGRLSHDTLRPFRDPPAGDFLVLPLLLIASSEHSEGLVSALERELFDHGGLQPPSMAAIADTTRLEAVHGQLMTWTDLAALIKMQLAGAGLDPFWPPVEHALLASEQAAELELPAGLHARWDPEARGWVLDYRLPGDALDRDDVLWLRAFRQTTGLLEAHLIPWRVELGTGGAEIEAEQRWLRIERGASDAGPGVEPLLHGDLGLIGYDVIEGGRKLRFLPLVPEAIPALQAELKRIKDDVA